MELLSKAFGILETNCYIVRTKIGDFIIDPGVDSAEWVIATARNPRAILNTHGHWDHIWCNYELKNALGAPIFCPKGDCFMLKSDCFNLGLTPCTPDFEVNPNESFVFGKDGVRSLGALESAGNSMESADDSSGDSAESAQSPCDSSDFIIVTFMHFPGHTPGCSMIRIRKGGDLRDSKSDDSKSTDDSNDSSGDSKILGDSKGAKNDFIFSGDFIFYRSIGRSDFPHSDKNEAEKSVKAFGELTLDLPLFPGHGQSTTIKDEQKLVAGHLRMLGC